jgi:hypothetical protein
MKVRLVLNHHNIDSEHSNAAIAATPHIRLTDPVVAAVKLDRDCRLRRGIEGYHWACSPTIAGLISRTPGRRPNVRDGSRTVRLRASICCPGFSPMSGH